MQGKRSPQKLRDWSCSRKFVVIFIAFAKVASASALPVDELELSQAWKNNYILEDFPPQCGPFTVSKLVTIPSLNANLWDNPRLYFVTPDNSSIWIPDYSPEPKRSVQGPVYLSIWAKPADSEEYQLLHEEARPKLCDPSCSYDISQITFPTTGIHDVIFTLENSHGNCADTFIATFMVVEVETE